MRKTGVVLIITLALLLAGCSDYGPGYSPEANPDAGITQYDALGNGTYRFVDAKWNVVCYVVDIGYGAGVDCVPLSQTGIDY